MGATVSSSHSNFRAATRAAPLHGPPSLRSITMRGSPLSPSLQPQQQQHTRFPSLSSSFAARSSPSHDLRTHSVVNPNPHPPFPCKRLRRRKLVYTLVLLPLLTVGVFAWHPYNSSVFTNCSCYFLDNRLSKNVYDKNCNASRHKHHEQRCSPGACFLSLLWPRSISKIFRRSE